MRRCKKKELLETADMLVEAHEVICRLCRSNTERALEILGQCQESAILLGNLIESRGEQYAELVKVLEDYCENIYQMSRTLSDEDLTRKQSKKIQKQLIYLNNKIRQEMPEDKKEVAFFPYKASMWDSLESVWRAADADEDTDAYVVPIPYYDRNPDGSFREMHYEGDEYPDYVPVTDYRVYDFEERRPDIIYIHNPYDQFNYVTSVDPRFYSSNLKQFTDKLVYIPYYILKEVKPDDEAAVEGIKHFCINQAVKNADKVIVQSEDMRQVYIKVLTEESGGSEEARAYWEKKIDGSGSPKVHKVLNTKKEDLHIPEEWMKMIRKPDGSLKKIIFYNTGVTALLKYDELMLKKIENVFQIFREKKEEITLLWRPHPLMESTLISMRPELWEKYKEMRERYKKDGWGIYDDTADMDRAIVLSDAYYGDASSVLQLYKKTGKPHMLQDIYTFRRSECALPISNGIMYGGNLWFVGLNDNRIYSMDPETFQATVVCRIPWERSFEKKMQYGKIVGYKNKIILIARQAYKIAVYDMETGEIRYVDYMDDKCGSGAFFIDGVLRGNHLYLIPSSYDKVVCLDVETEKVIKRSASLVETLKHPAEKRTYAFGGVAVESKYILFTMLKDNKIVKYDMESNRFEILEMDELSDGGSGILSSSENVWIIHKSKKRIERYNKKTGKMDFMEGFPEEFVGGEWNFHQGYVYEDDLILLPREANMCLRIRKQDRSAEQIKLEDNEEKNGDYWQTYMWYTSCFQAGNKLMIADHRGDIFICHPDGKIEKRKIKVLDNDNACYFQGQFDYEENNRWDTLECFLKYILSGSPKGGEVK